MTGTFQNAVAITELDLSDWTTDAIPVTMTNLFGGMSGLKSLTLGERSVFSQSTSLPNIPVNNEYTGRWILYDSIDSSQPIAFSSSAEFMNNYNGSHPGTYIWEPNTLKELSAGLHPVSDQSDSITGLYDRISGCTFDYLSEYRWKHSGYRERLASNRMGTIKTLSNRSVLLKSF